MSRPNPFSTRFTAPGSIEYLFSPGESAEQLVDRLRQSDWQGQIVGPHGSGKSTLLAALRPLIEAAGRQILDVTLHDGERCLPAEAWQHRAALHEAKHRDVQWIVDGYEQLGFASRYRLKRQCRRYGDGLLVTSHASVRLPELCRTQSNVETASRIVERLLLATKGDDSLPLDDLAERLRAVDGDVRELLFELYDLYEQRCRNR